MTSANADRNRATRRGPAADPLPPWVPADARQYVAHTGDGQSMRAIARADGQAPSTISRRVQALEAKRDDPLVDEALEVLTAHAATPETVCRPKETRSMSAPFRSPMADDTTLDREARRILRRLCETDAVLAVAQDMDKAVVLRPAPDGTQTRTAVVDRKVALAFAVKDWITCLK